MELDILDALDFAITVPSAWRFMERFAKVTAIDEQSFFVARYLLELSLIE